ncbi:MAG: hypothetical protein Q9182_006777 [Xanthomendoza sp. 2 TL-2023]
MKFTIVIAAITAFLPFALAVPATDDLASPDTTAPTDPTPSPPTDSPLNSTVATVDSAVDLNDSNSYTTAARTNNVLEARKLTRNSGLLIKAYRNKNCLGPLVPFDNVRYDELKPAKFQSYWISRGLHLGETLSLYGQVGGDWCGQETSHTPWGMSGGCKPLGGGSVGGASCFKLWRHQGWIY